jgi:hypothetical protein
MEKEKEKKTSVSVRPVSWSGDKVLMYQAQASYVLNKDRSVRIIGIPARSEDNAMKNLIAEADIWSLAIREITKELAK